MGALDFLSVHRRKDLEQAADDSYVVRRAEEQDRHRDVLGASDLSKRCDRAVWYTWRHARAEDFKGKGSTLRLFEAGHRQEEIFTRDLEAAGVKMSTRTKDGRQHRYALFGGHFAVNIDGLGLVPPEGGMGEPKKMIVEMKTTNNANFEKLQKKGVKGQFPGYYTQMQAQGMAFKVATGKDLDGFLFVAVNKDNSKYHFEEVQIDEEEQGRIWRLLAAIIQKDAPPPVLDVSPESSPCRFCVFKKICREGHEGSIEKSCRSCAYAEPVDARDYRKPGPSDSKPAWKCNKGHDFGTPCADWVFDSTY